VYCFGEPSWVYNGQNSGTPGWWYGGTSTGWVRDGDVPDLNTVVHFDDSQSVMQNVTGSYGSPGSSGPCHTVAAEVDGTTPQVAGIANASQRAVMRLSSPNTSSSFYGYSTDTSLLPQRGSTWWYGFAFRTNTGFVPHGFASYDAAFGNWNNFMSWHTSTLSGVGDGWGLGFFIGNNAPAGSPAGAQYGCGASLTQVQPYIGVAVSGGDMANSAAQTCLRWRGPNFVAGALYKVAMRVTWSADQTGSVDIWINGAQYVHATGISEWWKNGSTYDAGPYPLLYNYRRYDSSLPRDIFYFGGLIRGSTATDVEIP
jgi:Polysaccharide lyase